MVKNVVIVGGGTSGWMTAAYLKRALEGLESITVVESSQIRTIGVGEATFSTLKLFFDYLGLQEHDWMPACNATYKLAIRFEDWTANGGHFYHPFQRYDVVDGVNMGEWWLKLLSKQEPFDYSCFTIPYLCDSKRSPRYLDGRVFDHKVQHVYSEEHILKRNVLMDHQLQLPYGYHFDASLVAHYMQLYAMRRGVKQIVDDVVDVKLAENGNISYIQTKEHGPIHADLFVDCTGFRGLLINQTLQEPFNSFSESLLNNSAVALQVPLDIEKHGLNPYTTATAMTAGWTWKIPLYGRIGTGYVYCSDYLSKEDAEKELREHVGPASEGCSANHIKMRIGRNRNSWVKNCVAIGLASGFVEPLESTGIFFIQHGIEELVNHFPRGEIDERMVKSYNNAIAQCIDGVRDFLVLHYRASDRADTEFWKAIRTRVKVPESLEERLELWRKRLPNSKNINRNYHGFEFYSYSCMLLGLNYRPESSLPVLDYMDASRAQEMFHAIRTRARDLVNTLPSQYEYLTHVRNHFPPDVKVAYPAPAFMSRTTKGTRDDRAGN